MLWRVWKPVESEHYLWDFPVTNLLLPFQEFVFELDVSEAKPLNLIITSPNSAHGLHKLNPNVNVYVSRASLFLFNSTVHSRKNADHATHTEVNSRAVSDAITHLAAEIRNRSIHQ